MLDDQLAHNVTDVLTRAGLTALGLDDPHRGGFALQPDGDVLYIVWATSDDLSSVAFDHLTVGNTDHPSVSHLGEIGEAMAAAMLAILRSAGLNATMSTDDMAPATVEVRADQVSDPETNVGLD